MENEDLLWALARRLVQDDQVSQEEFHFMLYEYNAQTYPYSLYGDTKVDEMPYQNSNDAVADDLFDAIPKFSELMPKAGELTSEEAIKALPALRAKYEQDEAAALERMRKPNPLMDEDWGKSKSEIIAEAEAVKREDERKAKLMAMLEQYSKEDEIRQQLNAAKAAREAAVNKMLDAGSS